jgi:peptidoglycan/xylan/chitin deacetylase (PgdA/CDA1 family)
MIPGSRRPVILAYHGVGDADDAADPRRLVVSPRHLAAHIGLLRRRGYRFATAAELGPDGPPPPRTAVLTFDDGWLDALTTVTPLLARLGIRASFFVCPGWWGGQHPQVSGPLGRLLDRDGVRSLVEAGMDVGSHAMTHRDLRGLSDTELEEELVVSRAEIERVTGRPCRTFAHPFGLSDARTEGAAGRAGYDLALAWLPGPWRPLAAPRLPGPPRHGALRLALKLAGIRRRGP